MRDNDIYTPVGLVGLICSIIGLISVFSLQQFELGDSTLLFWWLTTLSIVIAAICTCFMAPSLTLRVIFALVFVAQMPAFNYSWGERYERDTIMTLQFTAPIGPGLPGPSEDERKTESLQSENYRLRKEQKESKLFWLSMAHLTGMTFALIACTGTGQRRLRIEYDDT